MELAPTVTSLAHDVLSDNSAQSALLRCTWTKPCKGSVEATLKPFASVIGEESHRLVMPLRVWHVSLKHNPKRYQGPVNVLVDQCSLSLELFLVKGSDRDRRWSWSVDTFTFVSNSYI